MPKKHILLLMRCFIVSASLILTFILFKFTFVYIYPFIIAYIISLLINPIVSTLETFMRVPRTVSTLFVLFTTTAILFGIFFLLTTEVFNGALYLADQFPDYFQSFIATLNDSIQQNIIPLYEKAASYFYALDSDYQITISKQLQELSDGLVAKVTSIGQRFFIQIPVFISIIPSSIMVIIIIILATFFITNDWNHLRRALYSYFPRLENKLNHMFKSFKKVILKYISAQFILLFISWCLIYSGFLILQIEHALTISLLIGLIDLLPVIGTGFIFIPWILYLFLTGYYTLTIGISVLYIIVLVMRQMLEPRMITASIGVNPLIGLIILFVSLQVFGGSGFLIAPVILIFIAVLMTSEVIPRIIHYIKGES